jgi:PPOX class probable F420-dependent enzyme
MATFPDSHRDLLDSSVATLATIDAEGFPQLTEVWFIVDEADIKISLNSSRHKTRNLIERPRCSLLLLDLANPYRYLEIRARAQVEPDGDYAFAQKVGAKYDADLKVHDSPGESRVIVTLVPVKIHAIDMGG